MSVVHLPTYLQETVVMVNNQVFVVVIELHLSVNTATFHCSAAGCIVLFNAAEVKQ